MKGYWEKANNETIKISDVEQKMRNVTNLLKKAKANDRVGTL
jgi:hypothetical protein